MLRNKKKSALGSISSIWRIIWNLLVNLNLRALKINNHSIFKNVYIYKHWSLSNHYWACGTWTLNTRKHGNESKNTTLFQIMNKNTCIIVYFKWFDTERNGPNYKYEVWFSIYGRNVLIWNWFTKLLNVFLGPSLVVIMQPKVHTLKRF